MKNYVLKSNFKNEILSFLELKHSTGYKYTTAQKHIEQFDELCFLKYSNESTLTEDIGLEWAIQRKNESISSHENRIVAVREFAKYLNNLNKKAFVIPTKYILKKTKYKSYIYSNTELKQIFYVIDNKKCRCIYENVYDALPVLFRILYGCGLRISEILNLKIKDVDLENGIIYVYESKNNNSRLVPISNSLKNIVYTYFNKIHLNHLDTDYFFYTAKCNKPFPASTLRRYFENILKLAGIEKNKKSNPRIHDFRHTFAVNCLKKFVKENKDLTAYMPILKTYMGHSKFISTEYYLKLTNDIFPDILEKVHSYISDAIPKIGGSYEQ